MMDKKTQSDFRFIIGDTRHLRQPEPKTHKVNPQIVALASRRLYWRLPSRQMRMGGKPPTSTRLIVELVYTPNIASSATIARPRWLSPCLVSKSISAMARPNSGK